MKAALDAAGRLVVPKSLRQALGLKPGQALEIRAGDGRLEIEIASTPMRHGAELVSCDRRAAVIYQRYRLRTHLL